MKILFFGIVQDIVGSSSLDRDLSQEISVAQLQEDLLKDYPKLKDIKKFAVAINETYATANERISNSDVVAIIPPVSGG